MKILSLYFGHARIIGIGVFYPINYCNIYFSILFGIGSSYSIIFAILFLIYFRIGSLYPINYCNILFNILIGIGLSYPINSCSIYLINCIGNYFELDYYIQINYYNTYFNISGIGFVISNKKLQYIFNILIGIWSLYSINLLQYIF